MPNTPTTVKSSPSAEVDVEHGIQYVDSNQSLKDISIRKVHRFKEFGRNVRETMKGPMSEFFGMFIIIVFGCGAVAQTMLSKGTHGDRQSVSFNFGIGVMIAIYVAGASGAQLNPAMTFTNCLYKGLDWKKLPVYIIFQTFGAFCGAALVYAFNKHAIEIYDPTLTVPGFSNNATAGIFATYPQEFVTRREMFASEFIASAILNFVVFALNDVKAVARGMTVVQPILMFFVVYGTGSCFGFQTGCALNLARDFGPRVFTAAVGYGTDVWKAGGGYFWIPMVAPFAGATFGGGVYYSTLQKHETLTEKDFDREN